MAYRTLEVHTKSTDFRKATRIVKVAELPVAAAGHVVIKNHYVGINATDVIITNGLFDRPLPFSCGVEGVGEVVAVGEGVENITVGDAIAYVEIGAFTEYIAVPATSAVKVPAIDPAVLPVLGQGMAGSTALEQFVVQLAKLAGNHVIGTTSSDEKAEVLKALGCDRVINYSKESIGDVLKAECPKGIDLVFETVGGETFKAAVENIAVDGRLIVFGNTSTYLEDHKAAEPLLSSQVNAILLDRSASVRGFNFGNCATRVTVNAAKLFQLIAEGKLKSVADKTEFKGLEAIPDAVEYMFARKNVGKLAIKLV